VTIAPGPGLILKVVRRVLKVVPATDNNHSSDSPAVGATVSNPRLNAASNRGQQALRRQRRGLNMKSPVIKRSILLAGHKTSVSLEEAFWQGLKEIANRRNMSVSALIGTIDNRRAEGNLSSCIRLFVLDHFRTLATAQPSETLARPDGRTTYAEGTLAGETFRAATGIMQPAFRRSA
jgi:predicted DNA-binding ribbon-helix-helix protein